MMEIKKRELDARIYFAMKAASLGYSVCFGKKASIYYYRNFLAKGLVFFKSFGPRNTDLIDKIKSSGHKILGWDEEGMTYMPEEYNDKRLYRENFVKMELFFSWGDVDTDIIKKYHPDQAKKVFKVGNSRVDVLKNPFNKFYWSEAKKIREKYGDFILFPTVFTKLLSSSLYTKDIGEVLEKVYDKDSPSLLVVKRMRNQQNEILKVMNEFFERFSKECPKLKLIVRPHPAENLEYWFKNLKEYKNIEVIFDDQNTASWIAASKLLVSTNCTTAIEAFFLGNKSINFLPFKDERVEYELPKICGLVVRDQNILMDMVKKVELNQEINDLNNLNVDHKIISKWLSNAFSHCSVEKTLDIIDKNEEISSFFKQNFKDKFCNNFFFKIFEIIKKIRFFYHQMLSKTKPYDVKMDLLIDQKFPGLRKDEIEYRVNFFSQFFKNRKFKVKELYPGVFSID